MKKPILFLLLTITAVTLYINPKTVFAEGFALTDYSAHGAALAGGLIGRASDPSAVAYNPAGITQLKGIQISAGSMLIMPKVTIDSTGRRTGVSASTHTKNTAWLNPHAYATYELNDKIWLGVGLFSRFGLGEKYPRRWPGHRNILKVQLQTISLNPNVAFKVTDELSLAIGLDIMGAKMNMERNFPFSSNNRIRFNKNTLNGHSVAFGGNIAAHYKFNEQWATGLTYRSRITHKVKGKSEFTSPYAFSQNAIFKKANAYGKLRLPDVISAAVTYTPEPNLSFEVDTTYTLWSVYKDLDIRLKAPNNQTITLKNPKNWKNTWTFSGSAEYKVLHWLALRAGYSYETRAVNHSHADYMVPSNGRHKLNIGTGFYIDQSWKIDLAYSYVIVKKLSYTESAKQTYGILPGKAHGGNAHILGLSLGYIF